MNRIYEAHQSEKYYEQFGGREEVVLSPAAVAETKTEEKALSAVSQQLQQAAEEYPDMVAWLQIPNTTLDYPVMLGEDNQFYLSHLPDGSRNVLGSLFLDCRTRSDSRHIIIYGHNGAGEKMFGQLKQYESAEYFEQNQTITISTAETEYICPIFSVRRVAADGDAYDLEMADREDLHAYIKQAAAQSLYPIEVSYGEAARIVTLSTCTASGNERLVVQALL